MEQVLDKHNRNKTEAGTVDGGSTLETLRRNEPVQAPEEKALESEWAKIQKDFYAKKSDIVWKKLVPLHCMWSDGPTSVINELANCELLQDGSGILFEYHAGNDAIKKTSQMKKRGLAKIKGGACKLVLDASISIVAAHMKPADCAFFTSGRNRDVFKYIKKEFGAIRPKPATKHYQANPDFEEFAKLCKLGEGGKCKPAALDPSDDWVAVWKKADSVPKGALWKYLTGSTAMKKINNVPMLQAENMPKATADQYSSTNESTNRAKYSPWRPAAARQSTAAPKQFGLGRLPAAPAAPNFESICTSPAIAEGPRRHRRAAASRVAASALCGVRGVGGPGRAPGASQLSRRPAISAQQARQNFTGAFLPALSPAPAFYPARRREF